MHEPRGFDGMYGALLVEKDLPEADMAVLFMHNEGMYKDLGMPDIHVVIRKGGGLLKSRCFGCIALPSGNTLCV